MRKHVQSLLHHLSRKNQATAAQLSKHRAISERPVIPRFLLNDGQTIPSLGMGTWGAECFTSDQIARSIDFGLRIGYNHIDNATAYGNQIEIGHVLSDIYQDPTIPITRSDIHITSKIWNNERNSPQHIYAAVQFALKGLQTDYLDLVLVHWPFANAHRPGPSPLSPQEEILLSCPFDLDEYMTTWKTLNELVDAKLIRSIGVSNMTAKKLDAMMSHPKFRAIGARHPAVNQVEIHPFLQQWRLIEYCRSKGIVVTAAMPLGSPERPDRDRLSKSDPIVLENPVIRHVAEEIGASPAQVVLAWHFQRGTICIPKATEGWMIVDNLNALSFELSDDQVRRIDKLDRHLRFTRAQNFVWYEGQNWRELWDE